MNAAQLHLMVVHLPVVGCLSAAVVLVCAHARKNEVLFKVGYGFLFASAISSVVAYYSGPPAYELLTERFEVEKHYVEQHAVIGRAAFVGMIVLGVAVVNVCLQYLQGKAPAKWLKRSLLVMTLAMVYVLAWAAHLGALVRHPEVREPAFVIFPELSSPSH